MTFCTQCGTDNDDSTKYCRECGKRLQPAAAPAASAVQSHESTETTAGQVLYDAFQSYETGSLNEAASKCRDALLINPRSSSAHALLSMIYEKHAIAAESEGDTEGWQEYLEEAISQRERVLELSPGSVVDSQKLKELKKKLNGDVVQPPVWTKYPDKVKAQIKKVPVPVLASASVTLVVFIIAMMVMGDGGKKQTAAQTTNAQAQTQAPAQQYPYSGGYQQQQQEAPAQTPSADGDLQFTSPDSGSAQKTPNASRQQQSSVTETPTRPLPRMAPPTVKLPPIPSGPLDVRVVPYQGGKKQQAPKTAQGSTTPTPSGSSPAQTNVQVSPSEKGGADYQREAMKLMGDGKRDEAASYFHRAIDAYNNEVAKGVDVERANAGIRTCRTFLQSMGQ